MKRIIIVFIVLIAPLICYGQFDLDKAFEAYQESLKKDSTAATIDSIADSLVMSKLFLLRQEYSLYDKKKKKYYGYDGKDHFGAIYSVGLRCKGFNILFDEAVNPWNHDENFSEFSGKNLVPVISASKYKLLSDTICHKYVAYDTIVVSTQAIKDDFLYASKPFTAAQDGFTVNKADTCKTGVIVWICAQKGNIQDDNAEIKLLYTYINAEMFGSISVNPPAEATNIIGAIYLTKSDDASSKQYDLSGIVIHKDDMYMLRFPFKDFQYLKEEKKEIKKKGKLTEIKK